MHSKCEKKQAFNVPKLKIYIFINYLATVVENKQKLKISNV